MESQITEIAQGAEINRSQLASLFAAVEQVRGDLSASEEQTLRLGEAASQLENQAEVISERLAEVSLDAYHQSVYDLAREGAAAIAARFEEDVRSGRIDLDDLFDRSYQPLPNTQPTKYRTRFDSYTDQVLPGIQEQLLERNRNLVFAIACTPKATCTQSRLRPSAQRRPADGRVAQPQQAPVQRPHRDSLRQPPAAAVATDLHP